MIDREIQNKIDYTLFYSNKTQDKNGTLDHYLNQYIFSLLYFLQLGNC